MLKLAVIADDLTGAADTGIQFRALYAPVYLVDHRFLAIDSFEAPAQALSIFNRQPWLAAGRSVSGAVRRLPGARPPGAAARLQEDRLGAARQYRRRTGSADGRPKH